jgi:NADPH:quinone reductase-like Zn-dependent oxidoreductase
MAVQLAAASGAQVTALVRDAATAQPLIGLGATHVVEELDGDFDLVVDGVGGATFGQAIEHLAPGGTVVNIATPEHDDRVSFRGTRFDRSPAATIYTLNLFDELRRHASAVRDLTRLCDLVAAGRLDGQVVYEDSWRRAGQAVEALLHGHLGGKVVLHVD